MDFNYLLDITDNVGLVHQKNMAKRLQDLLLYLDLCLQCLHPNRN